MTDLRVMIACVTFETVAITGAAKLRHADKVILLHQAKVDPFKDFLKETKRQLKEMGGLAKKMPVTAILWVMGAMMLSGFPPFASFTAEWIMFTGIFERGLLSTPLTLAVAIMAVLAILLTVGYSFAAARRIFFGPLNPALDELHIKDPPWTMAGPLLVVSAVSIFLGLYPRVVMDLFHRVLG